MRLGRADARPLFACWRAHRAFCAKLIFLRADAERIRRGLSYDIPPFNFPNTDSAASTRLSWLTRFVRSALNSETINTNPFRFSMSSPSRPGSYQTAMPLPLRMFDLRPRVTIKWRKLLTELPGAF